MSAQTLLRLIQFRAGYNLVVHAAIEQGHFARHGLEVEVVYTPGSAYLTEALKSGKFEIGHTAADDVIADVESHDGQSDRGSDLFLFMGLHSGLLSLIGAPEMRDLKSLRGKQLAVDSRTSGFVFLLEKALRANGFGLHDYTLVEVGGWESRFLALLQGKYAATLLTPPYIGQALAAGCHLLARGDKMIPVYQATGGAASRTWAKQNPETLVNYIRAYVEATQWCFDRRNRKACLELLAKHNGIGGAAATETLDALIDPKYGLYPEAAFNLPGFVAALELRAEMGHLARPVPPVEKYVDLSYYRKAIGQGE
ncbi:MAG: ABC transporter substrate-binding protein [Deltaproteobacteria bacterium]|nr:ABC transporter substrate-binding protein [Deltaproteobacteria bacterium]